MTLSFSTSLQSELYETKYNGNKMHLNSLTTIRTNAYISQSLIRRYVTSLNFKKTVRALAVNGHTMNASMFDLLSKGGIQSTTSPLVHLFGGDVLFYLKIRAKLTHPFKNGDFQSILVRSASAVTLSEKNYRE